jgi:hypothetical protein
LKSPSTDAKEFKSVLTDFKYAPINITHVRSPIIMEPQTTNSRLPQDQLNCLFKIEMGGLGFGRLSTGEPFHQIFSRGLLGGISSMYVRKFANPNLKPAVKQLVKSIRRVFKNNIKNLEWMDKETKENAFRKLDAMKQMIIFNEELTNKTFMDSFFKGYTITLYNQSLRANLKVLFNNF